jgi:PAS domain-containing protein
MDVLSAGSWLGSVWGSSPRHHHRSQVRNFWWCEMVGDLDSGNRISFPGNAAAPDDGEQARIIIDSMPDGFAAFDASWRYTYVNSAWDVMSLKSRGELPGWTIWDMVPGAIGTWLYEHDYREAAAERAAISFEDCYAPTGCWYSVMIYPIIDGGIAVYARDPGARTIATGSPGQRRRVVALFWGWPARRGGQFGHIEFALGGR